MSHFFQCGSCGENISRNMAACPFCKATVVEPAEPTIERGFNEGLRLHCRACETESSMIPTFIPRMSAIVRVIGVILLIPSFAGVIGSGITLMLYLIALLSGSPSSSRVSSDAEMAGRALGVGIGFIAALSWGILSFVFGLIGWLLLMNRNVWKCTRCGTVFDRA